MPGVLKDDYHPDGFHPLTREQLVVPERLPTGRNNNNNNDDDDDDDDDEDNNNNDDDK